MKHRVSSQTLRERGSRQFHILAVDAFSNDDVHTVDDAKYYAMRVLKFQGKTQLVSDSKLYVS